MLHRALRPSTKLPAARRIPHARRTPAQVGTLPMQPSLPPHVYSAPAAPPNAAHKLLGRVPSTPVQLGRQLTRQQRPLLRPPMLHAVPICRCALALPSLALQALPLAKMLLPHMVPVMPHAALPIPPSAMALLWHAPWGTTALLEMLQPLMLGCRLSARTLSTLTAAL